MSGGWCWLLVGTSAWLSTRKNMYTWRLHVVCLCGLAWNFSQNSDCVPKEPRRDAGHFYDLASKSFSIISAILYYMRQSKGLPGIGRRNVTSPLIGSSIKVLRVVRNVIWLLFDCHCENMQAIFGKYSMSQSNLWLQKFISFLPYHTQCAFIFFPETSKSHSILVSS